MAAITPRGSDELICTYCRRYVISMLHCAGPVDNVLLIPAGTRDIQNWILSVRGRQNQPRPIWRGFLLGRLSMMHGDKT